MTYKCWICGEEFEDGDEYAVHIAEAHTNSTLGVQVEETIETDDQFG